MASLKNRLLALERRLTGLLPLWPGDNDGFLDALGIAETEKEQYRRVNPDGSVGYDVLRVLDNLAASVWKEGDDV